MARTVTVIFIGFAKYPGIESSGGKEGEGERGGRSWSDRDESIRIEAWVYALLQRIALITDREGLVSRRKIASVSQSLRH